MTAIEGPRELKALAESSHDFVKTYMNKKKTPEPPMVFFTKQGIVIPDPKDLENAPRVFQRFLELAGKCYAKTFLARLRNENGDVVFEDALITIASDGGDLTYHLADPFTYEKREDRVVEIQWDEDCGSWGGWQSRKQNRKHMESLSPQQQRMLDYIRTESGLENQPLDWLRMLGMKIIRYPIGEADISE